MGETYEVVFVYLNFCVKEHIFLHIFVPREFLELRHRICIKHSPTRCLEVCCRYAVRRVKRADYRGQSRQVPVRKPRWKTVTVAVGARKPDVR
jgi:hypothetical protein